VDISAIPLAAVERVEVVADGASALYGSDAVGGVANIILRRDFNGLVTSARVGAATDGGDVEQQYNAVVGRRWQLGGILGTVDYRRSTAITAGQRSYGRNLDPSAMLLPSQEQISFVLTGHQQISDSIELEIDGSFSDRTSLKCTPFQVSADCRTSGALNKSSVRSFSFTPTVRFQLPAGWDLRVSGTHSESDTKLLSRTYAMGAESAFTRPTYNNEFDAFDVGAEGKLFSAPGGDARVAIGAGFRSVKIDVDSRRTAAGVTTPLYLFARQRDVHFAYGELSLPIVGSGNSRPMMEKLRVTGAVRYEKYQEMGDVATPKFGIYYEPFAGIALKGSWGKSFKAPTLFQEGQIAQGFLAPGFIFTPPTPGGKPLIFLDGGNPNLKPERATTWTTTLSLVPRFVEGVSLEASYFSVRYRNRVTSPIGSLINALGPLYADLVTLNPSVQLVEEIVARLPGGLTNQSGGPFDPGGVGAIVDNRLQNVAQQSIRGVDLAITYAGQLGSADRLSVSAAASYLESDQQLSADQPTTERAGTIFDPPHWRGRASATWEHSNMGLTGVATYIGGTVDDRVLPHMGVGGFASFDAIARFRTGATKGPLANLDFTLSLLNFLNETPSLIRPIDPAAARYDSTNYPAVGRAVSVTIAKRW
jgi:outer membrane receptor protein involved in Fe transport